MTVQDGVAGLTKRDVDEALIKIFQNFLKDTGSPYP